MMHFNKKKKAAKDTTVKYSMFRRFYLKPNQNKNPPKSICVLREKYQNLRDS